MQLNSYTNKYYARFYAKLLTQDWTRKYPQETFNQAHVRKKKNSINELNFRVYSRLIYEIQITVASKSLSEVWAIRFYKDSKNIMPINERQMHSANSNVMVYSLYTIYKVEIKKSNSWYANCNLNLNYFTNKHAQAFNSL